MVKMHAKSPKPRKAVIRMDPDCAICHAPATMACECEARGLEVAIKQAEQRVMNQIYSEIRTWVRSHAQDYILEYFRLLSERRKNAHSDHLDRITATAYYNYKSRPHQRDILEAEAALKRGIDEDWQASVQRYPEVLEYFFGLVELTLPAEDESTVKDPPLSALNGTRKAGRRRSGGASAAIAATAYYDKDRLTSGLDRRASNGRDRRSASFRPATSQGHHAPFYQQQY